MMTEASNTTRDVSRPHNDIEALTNAIAGTTLHQDAEDVGVKPDGGTHSFASHVQPENETATMGKTKKSIANNKKQQSNPAQEPPRGPRRSKRLQEQKNGANGQASDLTASVGWRQYQPKPASSSSARATVSKASIPAPTQPYMNQARQEPLPRPTPQPLLVILDLNGTILRKKPRTGSNLCNATMRPHSEKFLKWLFEESNHTVMIWSSITPTNVTNLVEKYIPAAYVDKLASVWARDTLRLSKSDYRNDGPVYKRLEWVWQSTEIQKRYPTTAATVAAVPVEKRKWGQHNTILIDDSCLKAATQPYNHIQVPEFVQKSLWQFSEDEVSVLAQVQTYLQVAALWADISQYVWSKNFNFSASGASTSDQK